MKVWERLVKEHVGVNRVSARAGAQHVADNANGVGMYASDSLQLMICAAQSWAKGGNKDTWWKDLQAGRITNQANGVRLDWMPDQFTKHELVWFARAGIKLAGADPDSWGASEPPPT